MKAHLLTLSVFLAITLLFVFASFFPLIGIGILICLLVGTMYWMALFVAKMYLKDRENDRTR